MTITGQIDNILNLNRNMNNTTQDRTVRGGQASDGDKEFGAYTRGRWDFIGQLGKARAVMGWEIDMHYGGFGATNADTCVTTLFSGTAAGNCGSRGDGSSGGLDADTDVRVPIELKWMYVEFPLMGPGSLLPFIPIEATARVGGQPFSLGMKPQQLADADFAGFRAELKFTPDVRLIALYHQIEENFSGPRSRVNNLATAGSANSTGWDRGDDFGVILKLDVEPFKGLRVSPLVAYQYLDGTTAGSIHTPVGGYPVTGVAYAPDIAATTALQRHCLGNLGVSTLGDKCRPTFQNRYWVGVDARLDQGPFYVWPTIIWQGGDFHRLAQNGPVVAVAVAEPGRQGVVSGRTDAWLLDVETGYRRGPLYLQGRFAYGTGNKPKDNLNQVRNYWEQFQHGGGYFNGFGEVIPLEWHRQRQPLLDLHTSELRPLRADQGFGEGHVLGHASPRHLDERHADLDRREGRHEPDRHVHRPCDPGRGRDGESMRSRVRRRRRAIHRDRSLRGNHVSIRARAHLRPRRRIPVRRTRARQDGGCVRVRGQRAVWAVRQVPGEGLLQREHSHQVRILVTRLPLFGR
ncbi:MAG: hypothetical protein DMD81_20205 [Candidatus Rokuibacteriota bacterium]|nr:MAG: hypothetical protein DMD81_20205 [Candidatus Rokubacteria bacterium]